MSLSISCGAPNEVKPAATKIVTEFLLPVGKQLENVWGVAKAGMNNNGPLVVQLLDELNTPLSDTTELFGSELTRFKFLGVKALPSSPLPAIVKVRAVNKSTQSGSNASVAHILIA